MSKRKNPATSNEAFYSLNPDMLVGLRLKIFKALQSIGSGHYEDIALAAAIEPMQCWKRLSELHNDGLIHRTGERKFLSSGRNGFIWAPGKAPETVQKREQVMKGPSISDISRDMQKIKPAKRTEQNLFSNEY